MDGMTMDDLPDAMRRALELQRTKGQDYNTGIRRQDYFPLGLASYAQEIHKKGLRLVSLAKRGGAPNHESVRDTCVDLINYACFLHQAVDDGEV
jgi:hypothetical protein